MASDMETLNRADLLTELEDILDEDYDSAVAREGALLEALRSGSGEPVVLFGAGRLGRRTARILQGLGVGVTSFADNDEALWGRRIDGIEVLSPGEASTRFAQDGRIIVTIWRAEGGHDYRRTEEALRRLGWHSIHTFIHLYWGCAEASLPWITIDRPTKVLTDREAVMALTARWADLRSLSEYVGQVKWRLTGDFNSLTPPEPDQYFARGVIDVRSDETWVDCGAYVGDTMLDVFERLGGWTSYHAFEPDPMTFATLKQEVARLPGHLRASVTLHEAASAASDGEATFDASGLEGASLSATGGVTVRCIPIDSVVDSASFIKMDIEGGEAGALVGARRTISGSRPILAIAAYHQQSDLWALPHQILSVVDDYRLFLRPHAAEGFETILYAIPPERLSTLE